MNLAHNTAVLWRGPGSVQVGGDRARHVLLDNLHASDQLWLSHQAHPAHERDEVQASPELLAALEEARLTDGREALPHLALGIVGAVPATLLALHSLVDTLSLSLSIETHSLVDEDWDRVFGGHYTGTPATARCDARFAISFRCPGCTPSVRPSYRSCRRIESSIRGYRSSSPLTTPLISS